MILLRFVIGVGTFLSLKLKQAFFSAASPSYAERGAKCPRFARVAKSQSDFFGGPRAVEPKPEGRRPGERRTEAIGSREEGEAAWTAQRTSRKGERCGRERPAGDGSRRLCEAEAREGRRFDPFPTSS